MPEVYPFSEDTELLLSTALEEVNENDFVLEVGSGKGVISSQLKDSSSCVVASDINPSAVTETQKRGVEAVRTDLYACLKAEFDLVLFNPPYLPKDSEALGDEYMDKAIYSGETGLELTKRFIKGLRGVLSETGRALIISSSESGINEVLDIAGDNGFTAGVEASQDLFFEKLAVVRLEL